MKGFGFGSRCICIGAVAALLSGCDSSHSGVGSPVPAIPAMRSGSNAATSSDEKVLYSFTGGEDGGNAATALVLDQQGNLYGTTVVGGAYQCGTVFSLGRQASPPWPETVLYNFTCYSDGKNPHGGVVFDPSGNLDGTTVAGGSGGPCASDGCGVVFQLAYQQQPRNETVLHNFTAGSDGFGPGGAVVFDKKGNVYGTTPDGGSGYVGVVYQVSHHGQKWHEQVIHTFTGGKDGGVGSLGPLLLDSAGDLYGVTEEGGSYSAGTVFKLSHSGKSWKLTPLYEFKGGTDAGSPYGGLVADASGNLYGTTYYGGANGLGTVFELARKNKHKYRERVLYSFKGGSDGSFSTTTLTFGSSNELYGTTSMGGASCDCGTIFEINAKSGKEKVLHAFGSGTDGAYPYYGLAKDASGNFYGSTVVGGAYGQGAVFEFTP